jgi:hypothetical protein
VDNTAKAYSLDPSFASCGEYCARMASAAARAGQRDRAESLINQAFAAFDIAFVMAKTRDKRGVFLSIKKETELPKTG